MSDPRTPPTNKPPAAPGSSRTVVIVVVVVLIVVAIAGIVLAGRKGDAPVAAAPAASSSAVAAVVPASASSATSDAASAPTASAPDEVVFLAGTDRLPPGAADTIAAFAQQARTGGKSVRVTVRYLTGANKARDSALAKARADAIHHALMADGVIGGKLQIEMVEMPDGSLTPRDAERAVLSLR